MEVKRGDRFKTHDGIIIEYTGIIIDRCGDECVLVRVMDSQGCLYKVGELWLLTKDYVVSYLSPIDPAQTDPLIREVVGEMRDPEFARKLAETAMIVWPTLEESKKQAYAAILRDVLPLELKRQIRPGKLCEDCNKEISDIIEDMK